MRDNRDPSTVGSAILELVDRYKVPVIEAAEHVLANGQQDGHVAAPPAPSVNGSTPRQDDDRRA